jgi:hypothetical protein
LEEFYRGYFYLGPINGVAEVSIGVIIAYFITGLYGNDIWIYPVDFFGWKTTFGIATLTVGALV